MIRCPQRIRTQNKCEQSHTTLQPGRPFGPVFPLANTVLFREISLQTLSQPAGADPRIQQQQYTPPNCLEHPVLLSPKSSRRTVFSHPLAPVSPTDVPHAFYSVPTSRPSPYGSHSIYACKVNEQMNKQTNNEKENDSSAHLPRSEH